MNEAHTNALGLADDDGDNVVSLEEFKNWVMANQSNVGGHTASMKEAVDEWGLTRLHYAARKGATRVVEKLLEEEYVKKIIVLVLVCTIILYPLYTFIAVHTPMCTLYTCINNHIYT